MFIFLFVHDMFTLTDLKLLDYLFFLSLYKVGITAVQGAGMVGWGEDEFCYPTLISIKKN